MTRKEQLEARIEGVKIGIKALRKESHKRQLRDLRELKEWTAELNRMKRSLKLEQ